MPHHSFQTNGLPHFNDIDPEKIKPTICAILTQHKQTLQDLLSQSVPFTWDNLLQPIEDMTDELNKAWSPIAHMHAVKESDALRKAYNETLQHLTEYHTEISQNTAL